MIGGASAAVVAAWARRHAGVLVAAAFGAAWFLWIGGWRLAWPFALEQALIDDWSTHVLGWLFYRNEPIGLPLGRIEGWPYPAGTTLGFSDSIPWLGVLHRPFASLLPADYQYIGWWMLLCWSAQGAMGAAMVRTASGNRLHQAFGGALLVVVPTLLLRIGHPSLCAHALLLAMIWLNLRAWPDPAAARKGLAAAFALNFLTAGVHPYLTVMVAALTWALIARLRLVDRRLSWASTAAAFIGVPLLHAALARLLGYSGGQVDPGAPGYGSFSADVLTFFNPWTYSRWLPAGKMAPMAYEGFAYLGVGGLLVVALGLAFGVISAARGVRWPVGRVLPLFLAVAGLTLLAWSWEVHAWGTLRIDLRARLVSLEPYVAPFRSSGRFIWPAHYLVLAGGLMVFVRALSKRPALLAIGLTAALALQVAEVNLDPVTERWKPTSLHRFEGNAWKELDGRYRHLSLFPAQIWGTGCGAYQKEAVISLGYLAYRHRLSFNSGYIARWPKDIAATCRAEVERVAAGQIEPHTVYVVGRGTRELFERAQASCGVLEGLLVCVRPDGPDPFATALKASPG